MPFTCMREHLLGLTHCLRLCARYANGLAKLRETDELIGTMSVELAELEPVLKESAESTATLMEQVRLCQCAGWRVCERRGDIHISHLCTRTLTSSTPTPLALPFPNHYHHHHYCHTHTNTNTHNHQPQVKQDEAAAAKVRAVVQKEEAVAKKEAAETEATKADAQADLDQVTRTCF